ncbi:NADH-quinone oxidoreductase subunit N [Sphingobacterium sp. SRCM116780]|uniref:NADH-quinone oxidoreductase subunit N n=1 Tax=Sphingobacterium sp. SRCM116780 TaxID=2907623 RepID=UPI001F2E5A8A|nr:NADH-quinone oxidoreductase subunit N [Sphingobacterium sp. SRCM116780]UIR56312.1 NADH-quinone oxidoreductase subunit N [Sphingobacterium sp. SRCM116780]
MSEFASSISSILNHIVQSIPLFKPELALMIAFVCSIICSLLIDKLWRYTSFACTMIGLLTSLYFLFDQYSHVADLTGFFEMIKVDKLSILSRIILSISTLLITIFIQQRFSKHTRPIADLYSVLLTATLGLHLLTLSSNWLLIFIAIETLSISSYIMVGYFSKTKFEAEAAMKYVLFGSICAAVMLYGLSLIYGFTGNLNFDSEQHIQGLIEAPKIMMSIAFLFLLTGIGFKLSFAPFHVWSPDVYQGAPTPITAYLSTAPKIGALVLLSRLLTSWAASPFYYSEFLIIVVLIIAIATMLIGNLAALMQKDVKRMMAYSSIGHTGILLMVALVYIQNDTAIMLFYLAIYALMNIAVFLFIDQLEQSVGSTSFESYKGLGKKYPLLFVSFSIVLISLIGLPPTAGFIGKLLVFSKVFEQYQVMQDLPLLLLLIVGALTSVISLFFYFKIPLQAFLREADTIIDHTRFNNLLVYIAVSLSILVVLLGLYPSLLLNLLK